MKNRTILQAALLILYLAAIPAVAESQAKSRDKKAKKSGGAEKIVLFNGKDLGNWVFTLKDNSVDPSSVFKAENGVIQISGDPYGYMRTKKSYSDYRLHVEWRWPSQATNSGVFVHAMPPDAIWLKCIECQLMAGNAGDFVCMNGTDMNERSDKTTPIVRKMAPSSEKKPGEWNTMDVECSGSTIEVYINGVLQNRGTGVSVSSGSICLQSEGGDIEFRNIYLTKLKLQKKETH